MSLAEQIAREHTPRTNPLPGGLFECMCDRSQMFNIDAYAAHIATVTERAVRERVEEESWLAEIYRSALRRFGVDPDEVDAAFRDGLRETADD